MRLNAEVLHSYLKLDLYSAGWLEVEDHPTLTKRQLAMNSINRSLLKKFHNDETDVERDQKALALFLECNDRCASFGTIQPRRLDEEYVIGELRSIVYDFFYPSSGKSASREPLLLNGPAIARGFGWGSGSNIGSSSTDFFTKLANSKMSTTNQGLPLLFRQAISSDKLWAGVEAFRHKTFGTDIVKGSRLSFVPKSRNISRTICTEPLLNMLYQKGIASVLEGRLREVFNIDLSLQPDRNARLARCGSIDGRFGTIDLSSASDTISMSLVRELIPREALNWLHVCRSPRTILPDGREIELHMISSMGNAYTFPLQTMIFASLVKAAYKVSGIRFQKPSLATDGNFAVFGDDIIVDHRVYDLVTRCLTILGFTVNLNKSFNEGFFRESCGSDYYHGYNIRGVYIQTLLDSGDLYSAINRLNRWSAYHGIFLTRTVGYLRSGCRFLGIPYDEADDAGIKVPLALIRNVRRNRNGAVNYLALCRVPRRVFLPPDDPTVTPSLAGRVRKLRVLLPKFVYHPEGLLVSVLAGHLRDGHITLRSKGNKTVLRKRCTPCWDYIASYRNESSGFGDRWKAFTEANLVSSLLGH
jgi:hypothetical protein